MTQPCCIRSYTTTKSFQFDRKQVDVNIVVKMDFDKYNTTVEINSSEFSHPAEKYKKSFKIFGVVQLISGLAVLGFGSYGLFYDSSPVLWCGVGWDEDYDDGYEPFDDQDNKQRHWMLSVGIYSGLMFIASGILGLVVGRKPGNCNVIGGLVMAVLSAIAAFQLVAIQISAIVIFKYYYTDDMTSLDPLQYSALAVGVIIFCVAIIHAGFSCATTCCVKQNKNRTLLSQSPPEYDFDDSMDKQLIEA